MSQTRRGSPRLIDSIYSRVFRTIRSLGPSGISGLLRQAFRQPVAKLPFFKKPRPTVRASIDLRFASTTVIAPYVPLEAQVSRQSLAGAAAVRSFQGQLLSMSFSSFLQKQFKHPNTSPRQEPAHLKDQDPYVSPSRSPRGNIRSDLT
ncbi:uncharacterized protein PG986_008858 [Apiospora aurea]|uniref:Uncharacterized protein n=1 Tax=Apiospora aurea TaxID=335848 RepID=A0ABR1Q5Y4_9PEZI